MKIILLFIFLTSGYTSKYDEGVFEGVIDRRQRGLTSHNIGPVKEHIDGFIAVRDCDLIDREVIACFETGCETLLIVDCAGIADGGRDWMDTNHIAGEVSPLIWEKHKIPGEALKMDLYFLERTVISKSQYKHRYEYS